MVVYRTSCLLFLVSFFHLSRHEINSYTILVPVFSLSFLLLRFVSQTQIDFENRKINNVGNDCLISVDGTDFALAWGADQIQLTALVL